MLGSRAFIEHYSQLNLSDNPSDIARQWHAAWFELIVMSKKVSQIIAWIWLGQDKDDRDEHKANAQLLHSFFIRAPRIAPNGEMYKENGNIVHLQFTDLLFAETDKIPEDFWELKKACNIIGTFFSNEYLPLLDSSFKQFLDAQVIFNNFEGTITDFDRITNKVIMYFPYPPRPVTVTDPELTSWYEEQEPRSQPLAPQNPFIPCSTT